jgi:hypothetical protein
MRHKIESDLQAWATEKMIDYWEGIRNGLDRRKKLTETERKRQMKELGEMIKEAEAKLREYYQSQEKVAQEPFYDLPTS